MSHYGCPICMTHLDFDLLCVYLFIYFIIWWWGHPMMFYTIELIWWNTNNSYYACKARNRTQDVEKSSHRPVCRWSADRILLQYPQENQQWSLPLQFFFYRNYGSGLRGNGQCTWFPMPVVVWPNFQIDDLSPFPIQFDIFLFSSCRNAKLRFLLAIKKFTALHKCTLRAYSANIVFQYLSIEYF